ncbi:MAG: hypothetical protein LC754_06795 [Acidobacteria bacterium]|nr:hypothetical protein [Acidobacteriota bacterium]
MSTKAGKPYHSDVEVAGVVRKFESCEFTPSEFGHRPHLTVSLSYLLRFSEGEALRHMRRSIHGFIAHHGIDPHIYHETMTVFWMKRVNAFVGQSDASRPLYELANELIESCGNARLIFDYYSRELIESEEARTKWVEPDLKPLDF